MRDLHQEIHLIDSDFCPDDRVWESGIEDIDNGDNFADYCKDFFEYLEEQGYYD